MWILSKEYLCESEMKGGPGEPDLKATGGVGRIQDD